MCTWKLHTWHKEDYDDYEGDEHDEDAGEEALDGVVAIDVEDLGGPERLRVAAAKGHTVGLFAHVLPNDVVEGDADYAELDGARYEEDIESVRDLGDLVWEGLARCCVGERCVGGGGGCSPVVVEAVVDDFPREKSGAFCLVREGVDLFFDGRQRLLQDVFEPHTDVCDYEVRQSEISKPVVWLYDHLLKEVLAEPICWLSSQNALQIMLASILLNL